MVAVLRVEAANVDVLDRVDPDCFDHAIDPAYASACVASPDALLVVAVDDGLVVGQCLAAVQRHPDKAPEVFVDDLGVAEKYKRRGIASALLELVCSLGRKAGATVLWVGVDPENQVARAFYRSRGLEAESAEIFERSI